jgi:TetR/AcrR family transcriptional repressor of nem operon
MTKSRDSRTRLLEAATKMTYRYGFDHTALADIAKEAKVPLGNVYYHFKTKAEIGHAIVERRMAHFSTQLEELNKLDSPKERLCGFVQIKIDMRDELARSGCPVGTMCSELHKHRGPVATKATVLFATALSWMETQFKALGKGAESRQLAVHLLSATQGVSVLAHTFNDPRMITAEAKRLKEWIRSL